MERSGARSRCPLSVHARPARCAPPPFPALRAPAATPLPHPPAGARPGLQRRRPGRGGGPRRTRRAAPVFVGEPSVLKGGPRRAGFDRREERRVCSVCVQCVAPTRTRAHRRRRAKHSWTEKRVKKNDGAGRGALACTKILSLSRGHTHTHKPAAPTSRARHSQRTPHAGPRPGPAALGPAGASREHWRCGSGERPGGVDVQAIGHAPDLAGRPRVQRRPGQRTLRPHHAGR